MLDSALILLAWFPSFFQSSKNGDCALHAAQSHGRELCVKKSEKRLETILSKSSRVISDHLLRENDAAVISDSIDQH